jgi:hypothetical protein
MKVRDMKLPLLCGFAILASTTSSWAQSLKPESPAPLQAGINKGTVDNFVGTHYWYFTSDPGEAHVHAQFKPMGLLGNPYQTTITVSLSDAANTWRTTKALTSDNKTVDYTFEGNIKKPTKIIVTVAPPSGGLVRMGGDYQLEVSGPVAFGEQSTADPIIGTYKEMCDYSTDLGDCKFRADGSIESTSGATGKWKLFDKDSQTYVVDIDGQTRHSLQYVPGRGLVEGDSIVFQELK